MIEPGALPFVGKMVSWHPLRSAIDECYAQHAECTSEVVETLPQSLRVIDIPRRRIVATKQCRFVALSYVWGREPSLRPSLLKATHTSMKGMMEDGGLPAFDMPQTIEDAMQVCANLGERYLWVDRLCIIQDDLADKAAQINAMGSIYSSACLVLVAAHGDSMDFGIPGISRPREVVQSGEEIFGLRIVNVIYENKRNPLALWETRGWTYQEATLARRRLLFTNLSASFECQKSISHEDQYNNDHDNQYWGSLALTQAEDRSRFEAFLRHIENYASRSLTNISDTYNALLGIQGALYGNTSTFIYGMPQVDFDRAMCWIHETDPDSTNVSTRVETPDILIPSWSWASTMHLPGRALSNQQLEVYGMVAPWFAKSDSFPQCLSEAINIHPDTATDEDWQLHMAIACSQGTLADVSFQLDLENEDFQTIASCSKSRWKTYIAFCKELVQSEIKSMTEDDKLSLTSVKPAVILTRTQATLFRLQRDCRTGFDECYVMDPNQDLIVGRIWGTASLTRELQDDATKLYEFIALTLSCASDETLDQIPGNVIQTKKHFDATGSALDRILALNVLMIGRRGAYAYRRFFGQIFLKDWARASTERKMIMLE